MQIPELGVHPLDMVQAQYQEKGKDDYMPCVAELPVKAANINICLNEQDKHTHNKSGR